MLVLDVLKDLLIGFLGALLIESAPKIALYLIQLAAQAMPTEELREQMLSDWTAEVLSIEGNAKKLVAAFWILINVPSIRSGLGYPRVDLGRIGNSAFARRLFKLFEWYIEPFEILLKTFSSKSLTGRVVFLVVCVVVYVLLMTPFFLRASNQYAVNLLIQFILLSAILMISALLIAARRGSKK